MTERDIKAKLIAAILDKYKDRFRIFDNTGDDKKVVAGQFPDVIFMQQVPPPNNNILFIMKVENKDTNLFDSVSEWKDLSTSPSVLYIVVPKEKLDDAKKLAARIGIRPRFASYEIAGENVKEITYE